MIDEERQIYQKFKLFPAFKTNPNKSPNVPKGGSYMDPKYHIQDVGGLNGHKAYGIICNAESGIMVMDVDNKEKPPKDSLLELFKAAKMTDQDIEAVRNTMTVKTPNGGYHFYFKFREGLRSSQGEIGEFIDFRTDPPDGKNPGYIMGPYSRIRAKDGQERQYLPIKSDTINDIPEPLYQFIKKAKRKKKASPGAKLAGGAQSEADPFEHLKGMKEGDGRNDAFYRTLISYCSAKHIKELSVMKSIAETVQNKYFAEPEPGLMATVESVHSALNEEPDYIYTDNGRPKINNALLAQHIAETCKYIIVRKNGADQDFFYWYQDGYYKRISVNEVKGKIKSYIPVEIRRASMMDEVYKFLVTDKTSVKIEDLDRDSKYINFKNGLFNVETKQLEPHTPDLLSTIQLNVSYDPTAPIPSLWHYYLDFLTGNDQNLKNILQEWTGLTISNYPGYFPKKAMALYGPNGNNGKSVFINLLDYLIGSENVATRDIQDLSKSFGTSDLYGKKALLIDDQKEADFTDSSIFKSITGGGLVSCEFKGKQAFSYRFNGTVTFGCNELPYLAGEKGSHIFERLLIIPCENVLKENERDPLLFENLIEEIDSIAQWALEGFYRLRDNNFKFTQSEAVNIAGEEYRAKSDSLYRFVSECCILTEDSGDRVEKTRFENAYENWAMMNDISNPIHKKNIKDRARKMGIRFGKVSNYYYMGVLLGEHGEI